GPAVAAARSTLEARRYLTWSRFPYFRVEPDDGGSIVRIDDARYPDGRLAGVAVRLDEYPEPRHCTRSAASRRRAARDVDRRPGTGGGAPPGLDVRQEAGEQADCGQERAQQEHELDARRVGEAAKGRGADASEAEREAEEQPRDRADPVRHQLLAVHDDRRERGRED